MEGGGMKTSKVVSSPVNFLTWIMSLFLWKARGEINYILVLSLPFLSGRSTFFPWWTICHLSIFGPTGTGQPELLFSPVQRCSTQCYTACFMWKENFIFMQCFVWENQMPWKYCIIIFIIILKFCLPWLCSELRGTDKQPAAYWHLQFFLQGGGMVFWRLPLLACSKPSPSVSGGTCVHWRGEPSSNVIKWMMDEFCVECRCLWMPHPAQLTAGLKLKSTSSPAVGQCRGNLEIKLWAAFKGTQVLQAGDWGSTLLRG